MSTMAARSCSTSPYDPTCILSRDIRELEPAAVIRMMEDGTALAKKNSRNNVLLLSL